MPTSLIRNIWAVGRNYADHAAEMKVEIPKSPMIFLKAGSTVVEGLNIRLPQWSKEVHYELEIAYRIDDSLSFGHLTLALDLTARDAQSEAKAKGSPWTLAKSFSGSCPLAKWISIDQGLTETKLHFELKKNEQVVQRGNSQDMIFKPHQLLEFVKKHFPVVAGDVLLTGTPAGVGALSTGDKLQATLRSDSKTLLTCLWNVE